MKPAIPALFLCGIILSASACGPRVFTRGERIDAEEDVMLDDEFSDSDMRIMAEKIVGSMLGSALFTASEKRPIILISRIANRTEEHIEMDMISDEIRVAISRSGKVSFVDGKQRDDILKEYEYQQSGIVRKDTATGPGRQIGADYFLGGVLSSRVQQAGPKKVIYYKLTVNLTNLESGLIDWTDDAEVKKAYKKRNVGW